MLIAIVTATDGDMIAARQELPTSDSALGGRK